VFDFTTVHLSDRAYADILNETSQHLSTETGGVLIGAIQRNRWFVVESVDPGPLAILRGSYFEYDHAYVNHLANKVRQRYVYPLRLLGLWHRHPGSFDRFSATDDTTHRSYLRSSGDRIISGLVNVDPQFRLTFYLVDSEPPQHRKIRHLIGDDHFPPELLCLLDAPQLLARINSPSPPMSGPCPKPSRQIQILDAGEQTLIRAADPSRDAGPFVSSLFNSLRSVFSRQNHRVGTTPKDGASRSAEERTDDISPVKQQALDMLDIELEYLDSQSEFEYELEMTNNGVQLKMQRLMPERGLLQGSGYRAQIIVLFTVEDRKRLVKQGTRTYAFRKGILQELIAKSFI
jgi:integrative and conjugative element protein (TIGR02256 family)